MSKRTASAGFGSLGTGAVTAVALAVQTGLAAVVGVIVAHKFGRSAETDGFFAAYAVFVVVLLAANAIRVVVLPPLARARAENQLAAELAAYALTMATLTLPLLVVGLAAAHPLSWLLTGNGVAAARTTATDVLPWMVLAAVLQLFAGLLSSCLAALDDYVTSAAGFVLGSTAGLAFILVRVDTDGIEAVSRGMAVNATIALLVPAAGLAWRARREGMPHDAVRASALSFGERLRELGTGIALALALQALYLICVPLAGREGTGAVTSFGYAYLIGSAVVAVTGSSLGLVTAVPLTRAGIDPERTARHVVASSWLSFVAVGGAAGIFGLAGGRIVHLLLGTSYGAHVGSQLGRLVVVLSLWAVVSIGISSAFPLVFVAGGERHLPLLALGTVAIHVPIAFLGQLLAGLYGLALALALTTGLVLAGLLAGLHATARTARGLGVAALTVGGLTVAAFGPLRLVLEPVAAAAVGTAIYCALLLVVRPAGLRSAWRYLRAVA